MNATTTQQEVSASIQHLAVLDAVSVLENLEYDLDIYSEMVEMYLERYTGLGKALVERLRTVDQQDLLVCAHELKGIAGNIGGRRLAEIARRLQDLCLDGQKPDPAIWAALLETESASFQEELQRLDWGALGQLAAENS